MSDDATARPELRHVDGRDGATSTRASTMRIRTTPGRTGAPNSVCVNGRAGKPAATSSTPRSERRMRRSRRWVQLRSTTESADMSGATTSSGTNEASDGPDTSCNGDVERRDDRRSADAPYAEPGMAEHDPGQEDARELSADEARRPGAASCPDPLALLFEHAVMLTRMAAVGATETLKLL